MKLYEEYKILDLIKQFYDKIRVFIEQIKDENDYIRKEDNNKINVIMIKNESESLFVVNSLGQFWCHEHGHKYDQHKYDQLERYLYKVMSPYFKEKFFKKQIPGNVIHSKIGVQELTQDIVDDIEFSKEEYEIFEDTERFGL